MSVDLLPKLFLLLSLVGFTADAARGSQNASPDAAARAQDDSLPGRVQIDRDDFAAFIDAFFESEMEKSNIPGAVFLMVKDGEVFYARGYGYADLERREAVDPEATVFRVGSLSKSFTAVAVLQLVEAGQVDLHEDANAYLERVTVPETFEQPVTLFHLLTRTAGFNETLFGQHARTRDDWLPLAEYLAENLPGRFIAPGHVISYNDHGPSLAGLVVEEVTGQPFAEYVDENIFQPLGMRHTSFEVLDLPEPIAARLAKAYRYEDGEYFPYEYDYILTPPAAGLVSTAADIGRFMNELLEARRSGATRMLSDSMIREMTSRQFGHLPKLPGRAFGFVQHWENQQAGLRKDGQATGFTARMLLLPEHDIGFFVAINRSIFDRGGSFNRAAAFRRLLTTAILDHYFPTDASGPEFEVPEPSPQFAERAVAFTGTYRDVVGSRHTIEKMLYLALPESRIADNGDGTLSINHGRWTEIEPLTFQWGDGGPFYSGFKADADGQITHYFAGAGTYERVPWYATQTFSLRALATFAVVFLSGAFVWGVLALVRRLRRTTSERPPHPGRTALSCVCALQILFLLGFGLFMHFLDFQDMYKGVPVTLAALLVLPEAAALLSLALPFYSFAAWRGGRGTPSIRIYYTTVTLAALLYTPFLYSWKLLGFHF